MPSRFDISHGFDPRLERSFSTVHALYTSKNALYTLRTPSLRNNRPGGTLLDVRTNFSASRRPVRTNFGRFWAKKNPTSDRTNGGPGIWYCDTPHPVTSVTPVAGPRSG